MTDAPDTPKNRPRATGCLLLLGGTIAVCIVVIVWMNLSTRALIHAVMVGKTGPISSPDDWPQPLKDLCADAEHAKLKISEVQVHCLCQGFDPEYVWRMESTPGLLDYLKQKWGLSPVAEPRGVIRDGQSHLSGERAPSWWNPMESKNSEFYGTLAGEKSDRFQVALDRSGNTIFVHYWFKF